MATAKDLDELLLGAIEADLTPGCVAQVWRAGELCYSAAHGMLARHGVPIPELRPVTLESLYDLASLTKVLSTTTLAALAVGRGELELDARAPAELAVGELRPTLRDLLEHASGLAAHREFYHAPWWLVMGQREELLMALRDVPPDAPPRERAIYSDLGFILLGAWLERHGGAGLDELFTNQVARPLGLEREIFYGSTEPLVFDRVAATEVYDTRWHAGERQNWYGIREAAGQKVARGLVHDDNCLVMGGVAGHAGLFGTVAGVVGIARAWLERRLPGLDEPTCERLWQQFTTPSSVPGSTRRLGFDGTNPDGSGSTGDALSPRAVGHLGFTGTSSWLDPGEEDPGEGSVYVLLTNRVHPTREEPRIRELRRNFHAHASALS